MRKLFSTRLAIMVLACATILVVSGTQVYAQAFKQPMLDGVPYSDFAQWSHTYGGGAMYGGGCPPMPQAGMYYSGPPAFMDHLRFQRRRLEAVESNSSGKPRLNLARKIDELDFAVDKIILITRYKCLSSGAVPR